MERLGNYGHCLPEFAQGRRAIWTAVNPHTGKRRIDEAFPHDARETQRPRMLIRFINGIDLAACSARIPMTRRWSARAMRE